MIYENLGDVVSAIANRTLIDGSILTNVDTNERVIVRDQGLYFLTINDYVSNEVSLVKGLVTSSWELEEPMLDELTVAEAINHLVEGHSVEFRHEDYGKELLHDIEDFLAAVKSDLDIFMEGNYYDRGERRAPEPQAKYRRRTTDSEVWGILMDYYVHDRTVSDLANKYDMTKRNIYFITSGAYFQDIHRDFMNQYHEGVL